MKDQQLLTLFLTARLKIPEQLTQHLQLLLQALYLTLFLVQRKALTLRHESSGLELSTYPLMMVMHPPVFKICMEELPDSLVVHPETGSCHWRQCGPAA